MKTGEPTADEIETHNEWNDHIFEMIREEDPEIALHALTSVIARVIWDLDDDDKMIFMIDVMHMLSHKFETIALDDEADALSDEPYVPSPMEEETIKAELLNSVQH
jgi:hypothetical protein